MPTSLPTNNQTLTPHNITLDQIKIVQSPDSDDYLTCQFTFPKDVLYQFERHIQNLIRSPGYEPHIIECDFSAGAFAYIGTYDFQLGVLPFEGIVYIDVPHNISWYDQDEIDPSDYWYKFVPVIKQFILPILNQPNTTGA